jgi:branched-chain amino acid transport system ATP-binding protein
VLSAIQAERTTVLFVEHDMEIVRRYTQRVLAFYEGRVIADGEPARVLDDADVRKYVVGIEDQRTGGARC